MISEKTVELNLSRQIADWFQFMTLRQHFVIAPSQQDEGYLGYDVELVGGFRVMLIQYKRAYVTGDRWTWRLNRTRLRDQHERLQRLEANGLLVYYGFPHFATAEGGCTTIQRTSCG